MNNNFALNTRKQLATFLGLSSLIVIAAFLLVQLVTQLGGWYFGALLASAYWLFVVGVYLLVVLGFYLFRKTIVVDARAFMKTALSTSFLVTVILAGYVILDIFTGFAPQ